MPGGQTSSVVPADTQGLGEEGVRRRWTEETIAPRGASCGPLTALNFQGAEEDRKGELQGAGRASASRGQKMQKRTAAPPLNRLPQSPPGKPSSKMPILLPFTRVKYLSEGA